MWYVDSGSQAFTRQNVDICLCLETQYNIFMIRAYNEIVDFIAAGTTPQAVAAFSASFETKERVAELINLEKIVGLSADERSELDHYLEIEHLMRLAKAKARKFVAE